MFDSSGSICVSEIFFICVLLTCFLFLNFYCCSTKEMSRSPQSQTNDLVPQPLWPFPETPVRRQAGDVTQGSRQREGVEGRGPLLRRLGPETTPVLKMVLGPFPARAWLVPASTPHSAVGAGRLPFTQHSHLRKGKPWTFRGGAAPELRRCERAPSVLLAPRVEQAGPCCKGLISPGSLCSPVSPALCSGRPRGMGPRQSCLGKEGKSRA